jgi:uncharacterized repeat protein (TIGR01451 family)
VATLGIDDALNSEAWGGFEEAPANAFGVATVTNANADFTVTFDFYAGTSCTIAPFQTDANVSLSVSDGTGTADSSDVTALAAGTYSAEVTYNYQPPVTSTCVQFTVAAPVPFTCSAATIFMAQQSPTQLYTEEYQAGETTFASLGAAGGGDPSGASKYDITSNGWGYDTTDDLLYANGGGDLLQIDSQGIVSEVGTIATATPGDGRTTYTAVGGGDTGAFDFPNTADAGTYYMGNGGNSTMYAVDTTPVLSGGTEYNVATPITIYAAGSGNKETFDLGGFDFAFDGGDLYALDGATGAVDQISDIDAAAGTAQGISTSVPTLGIVGDTYGAAWTLGNGNLGFEGNTDGNVYEIAVDASGSSPTYTLVSHALATNSTGGVFTTSNNDGAACIGQPADLTFTKTGPSDVLEGGSISWDLTVTDNGPGDSSGFAVSDDVPASVTGVATTTAGCTVGTYNATTGTPVLCTEGALDVGDTFSITITGTAPDAAEQVTNSATLTGNDAQDPGCTATSTTPPPCNSTAHSTTSVAAESATLSVVKSVTSKGPYNAAGETIDYSFVATNTGNVTMTDVTVSDAPALTSGPDCSGLTNPVDDCTTSSSTTLAPGQIATFTGSYTITQSDVDNGSVTDTPTVTGVPPGCKTACQTSSSGQSVTVPITQSPGLSVVKSVTSKGPYNAAGETIDYSFVATDTGNETMTDVTVSDSPALTSGPDCTGLTNPTDDCTTSSSTTLAPGQIATFTGSYTITQSDVDNGSVTDTPTVTGDKPGCDLLTCQTSETGPSKTVTITQSPGLSVVKTVTSDGPYTAAGQSISYQFVATDTGNETMTDVTVSDSPALTSGPDCTGLTNPTADCTTSLSTTLAPGQAATFTGTYTISQSDVDNGSVTDTPTVTGDKPGCASVQCATSTSGTPVTVTITQSPGLSVVKTVTSTGPYNAAGQTISYSFAATNTGNVTMTDVTVSDSPALTTGPTCSTLTKPTGNCTTSSSTTLAPAQVATFTGTYTITQADMDNGSVTDTPTVSGHPPCRAACQTAATGTAVTVTLAQSPALSVVKSVTSSGPYTAVGQKISYSFVATNIGNVSMTDVTVSDAPALTSGPTCAGLTNPAGNCTTSSSTTLAPGQIAMFTGSYTITQTDLNTGSVTDTPTVTGDPPGCSSSGCESTSTGSSVTVPVAQSTGLTVVKTSPTASYSSVGAKIVFDFLVTNTGNVPIHGISVTDTMASPATQSNLSAVDCPDTTLAVGAHETCTATYTVTEADLQNGSVRDTATATGLPPGSSQPVTSPGSTLSVPARFAQVTVTKGASTLTPASHTDDIFTLKTTNKGPSSAGEVEVTDVLQNGLDYVSSTATLGSVSVSGQTVTWTIPDLGAPGDDSTATLSLVVDVDTTASVTNTATFVQTTPGSSGTTGTSNTVTLTPTYADIALSKTIENSTPQVGEQDSYTITASNRGPDPAPSVIVSDPLPSGETFVSASTSTGTTSESTSDGGSTVKWDVGSLANGASATLDLVVTITAQSGSIANTASVTDSLYDATGQTKTATAVAAVVAAAVVPPTHTGQPWSGIWYWLLLTVLGAGGVTVLELGHRRRRRHRSG